MVQSYFRPKYGLDLVTLTWWSQESGSSCWWAAAACRGSSWAPLPACTAPPPAGPWWQPPCCPQPRALAWSLTPPSRGSRCPPTALSPLASHHPSPALPWWSACLCLQRLTSWLSWQKTILILTVLAPVLGRLVWSGTGLGRRGSGMKAGIWMEAACSLSSPWQGVCPWRSGSGGGRGRGSDGAGLGAGWGAGRGRVCRGGARAAVWLDPTPGHRNWSGSPDWPDGQWQPSHS